MRYLIADEYLEDITKKVKRVTKKCAALGLPFTFEVQEADEIENAEDGQRYTTPAHWVEISGIAKINGWTFVAKIQEVEDTRVLLTAPDQTCPEYYRTAPMTCDHCNSSRYRKETFVIVNEEGEYKQVGRNCLALYTNGLDAEACAQFAEIKHALEEYDDLFPSGCSGEYSYPLKEMVAVCYAVVKENGYNRDNTMGNVLFCFNPLGDKKPLIRPDEALEKYGDKADEIIKAANAISDDADGYLANVKALFSCQWGYETKVNFYASFAARFIREEMKAKAAAKKAESNYIGSIDERIKFTIKNNGENTYRILYTKAFSYGWNGCGCSESYVVEFIDINGNVIIWSASRLLELDEAINSGADAITLIGTVKQHSEYKGVKQTKVTRVRVA